MAGDKKRGTSIQRVRKYRARKASTAEGKQEMKNKNNLYKARSRRKMKIKRLSAEKAKLLAGLSPTRQIYVDNKSLLFRADVLRARGLGEDLTKDEQQMVDIEVLTHEINLAKMLRAKEVAERRAECVGGPSARLPSVPFLEDDPIEDDELMDALSTSFGTAAAGSAYAPLRVLFATADAEEGGGNGDDVDDALAADELFRREVSALFGGAPEDVPSSAETPPEAALSSTEAFAEYAPPEDVPSSTVAPPEDAPSAAEALAEDVPSSLEALAEEAPSSMDALAEDGPSFMEALGEDVPSSMESLVTDPTHGTWGSEVGDEDLLSALSSSLDRYLR